MSAGAAASPQGKKALRKQIEASLRYRILRRLFPQRPQGVQIGGRSIIVRPGTTDLKVAIESLGEEFTPVAGILAPDTDGLIIDAGGYIGTAAIKLSEMFPRATIVSVEASSANFAILSRNVARYRNIHPVHAALVAEPSRPSALRDRGTGNWGFTTVAKTADKTDSSVIERVSACTLPELCDSFSAARIAFLKLDIEGAGKSLFDGDPDISGMELVDALMVELHDRILPGCYESLHRFAQGRAIQQTTGEKFLLRCT